MAFPIPIAQKINWLNVITERSKQHSFRNMDTGQYEKDGAIGQNGGQQHRCGETGHSRPWADPGGGGGHQSHPMSQVSGGWPSPDRSQITMPGAERRLRTVPGQLLLTRTQVSVNKCAQSQSKFYKFHWNLLWRKGYFFRPNFDSSWTRSERKCSLWRYKRKDQM